MVIMLPLPPDNHVHSEWSWDTPESASMEQACERAWELGLPSVAFTEHLDFRDWGPEDFPPDSSPGLDRRKAGPLDLDGYAECLERCRHRFPGLRVLAGLEAGEPNLFAGSPAGGFKTGSLDRVLGSHHAIVHHGQLTDMLRLMRQPDPGDSPVRHAREAMREYFAQLVRMVEDSSAFEVLAHPDYPRRAWPGGTADYDERQFEAEYREVFRILAGTGRVLEINTRSPLASATLLRWWRDEGGAAVSFGSDAHVPWRVADQFDVASAVAETAGFRPGRDRFDFWRV